MNLEEAKNLINSATTRNQVINAFARAATAAPVFGVEKQNGVSLNRTRKAANAAALEIIDRVGGNPDLLTEEDRVILRQYSGVGGTDAASETNGQLHEYYTPTEVAQGIWDIMAMYGANTGNTLEPSAGTGVFNGTKPAGVLMTATEIDQVSSSVNRLLHPEDEIRNMPFEQLAVSTEDNTFDSVVGNVPFGSTRGKYGQIDEEYKKIEYVDQYFVTRIIDKVKHGGMICVVVPPRIVENRDWDKWRKNISLKAEFLGAHRLPSGTFNASGTDTVCDVLVMRKHTEQLADKIADLKEEDLKNANVLWDPFITGQWFKGEGKRFIMGEESRSDFNNMRIVDGGNMTKADIRARMARKFDSRIDFAALNSAEPTAIVYAEGDQRLINGRWMEMTGGQWEPVNLVKSDGTISEERYGMDNFDQLRSMLESNPLNALQLTHEQLINVYNDFPRIVEGAISDIIKLAAKEEPKYRERIIRGGLIGMKVVDLQQNHGADDTELAEVRGLVLNEIDRFGVASAEGKIASLRGRGGNYWNAFVSSTDKNGEFSDLMKGELDVGDITSFDSTDAGKTISHIRATTNAVEVSLEDFLQIYTGSGRTLGEIAAMDGVAITPDGNISPFDLSTSGDVIAQTRRIKEAMGTTENPRVLDNYQRQLDSIEKKRQRTPATDIEFTMSSKWIPRQLVLEFLKDNGYADMTYSKVDTDEEGNQFENFDYEGADGIFSGYTMRDGKKRNSASEAFERWVEKYLNGITERSSAEVRKRIKYLEKQFATWLLQHDELDNVVDLYNDTFNGFIDSEYSDASLNLKQVSGEIENFGYQVQEIRRLSEAGVGITAFGTGLGKSATALGLVEYNTQIGRAKRTAIVVPKAVIENWYHESKQFYGEKYISKALFVGLEVQKDKDGNTLTEPVLTKDGEPKLNKSGEPIYRDKIKILSGDAVRFNMNRVPQSNFSLVVMTKEQFAQIPMRLESVEDHVNEMVSLGLLAEKYSLGSTSHKEALKNEKFRAKYADTGSSKAKDIPYLEDMGIDNIIVDEGHNYRNSYRAGGEASRLKYLSTSNSADVAIDMAMKSNYIRRKNNGRGVVLLTATPTVNSPTDVFNMLSLVMTPEDWGKYGIVDVSDFIRVFGETENVLIQKLSGKVEEAQALVGFKNLSGLRGIFHRFVNMKDQKDVSDSVYIPPIEDIKVEVETSPEQAEIYEELRQRADDLNQNEGEQEFDENGNPKPDDSVFAIIRDMDRVTTDLDLYNRTLTYHFPADKLDAVEKLVDNLPATKRVAKAEEGKEEDTEAQEKVNAASGAKITIVGDVVRLVVNEDYEDEVNKRFKKFGIDESTVNHPLTPKYARLIENLKEGLKDGKQIIFTEEKSQHNKLRRILAHNLDIKPSMIGIINADTAAAKKAKKGESEFDQLTGLETIALAYNEGRHTILIANKKAEVGVNLHHGTTDIHHLTLPWTPASIKQRNGRGARVGGTQEKVRAHYYIGKGSFDEFRLAGLQRKQNWMNEIFTSDAERMKNADADDSEDYGALLAVDEVEREARIAENKRKAIEKIKKAAQERAAINLNNFLKAAHDIGANPEEIRTSISTLKSEIESLEKERDRNQENWKRYERNAEDGGLMADYYRKEARDYKRMFNNSESILKAKRKTLLMSERRLNRINKAESQMLRLRPEIERAINENTLEIPQGVLDKPKDFLYVDGRFIEVGKTYAARVVTRYSRNNSSTSDYYIRINSISFDKKNVMATVLYVSGGYSDREVGTEKEFYSFQVKDESSYTDSELELMQKMNRSMSLADSVQMLDESDWYKYFREGRLQLDLNGAYLLRNDAGEYSKFESYRDLPDNVVSQVVYPDANNEKLKAELAKYIRATSKNTGAARGTGYDEPQDFYKVIFGDDVGRAIDNYGSKAPEEVITKWVFTNQIRFEQTPKFKEAFKELVDNEYRSWSLERYWEAFMTKELPEEWDNHAEFMDAAIKDGTTSFKAKAAEKRAEIKEMKRLNALDAYQTGVESSKEAVAKRLLWLLFQHSGLNAYTSARNLQSQDNTPYTDIFGDYFMAGMIADMDRITGADMPDNPNYDAFSGRFYTFVDDYTAEDIKKFGGLSDEE